MLCNQESNFNCARMAHAIKGDCTPQQQNCAMRTGYPPFSVLG